MAAAKEALPEHMFDLRHIDRFLAEGKVTRAQYDAWLASLADDAPEAEESAVRMTLSDASRRTDGAGPHEEDEG